MEWIHTLNKGGTNLPSHCDKNKTPGIDMTTGSLGQGFSTALGMAMGLRHKQARARVYTLLGDGELQEGQVWEVAMFAGYHRLSGLTAIVDNNRLQLTGPTGANLDVEPVRVRWSAFGWRTAEVDGHDIDELVRVLDTARTDYRGPTLIVARTVKGKGVSFMENSVAWHSLPPNEEQLREALLELRSEG